MKISPTFYSTIEMSLAAALLARGIELHSMVPISPGRFSFVFDDNGTLETLSKMYWSHHLEVDALAFFESMKTLKSRVHSA
ncbi:MAG: DUF5659 domain-containing protein [bacterium]